MKTPHKIIIVVLIIFLTKYTISQIVRYNRPYIDTWELVGHNLSTLAFGVVRLGYYTNGIIPPLGEYPPNAPETINLLSNYKNKNMGELIMPHTTILVISCDFETGKIYAGCSNVEIALRQPDFTKNRYIGGYLNEYKTRINYYRNAKGELYLGGDTILLLATTITSNDLFILKGMYTQ